MFICRDHFIGLPVSSQVPKLILHFILLNVSFFFFQLRQLIKLVLLSHTLLKLLVHLLHLQVQVFLLLQILPQLQVLLFGFTQLQFHFLSILLVLL